jgi:hypothetical protein
MAIRLLHLGEEAYRDRLGVTHGVASLTGSFVSRVGAIRTLPTILLYQELAA